MRDQKKDDNKPQRENSIRERLQFKILNDRDRKKVIVLLRCCFYFFFLLMIFVSSTRLEKTQKTHRNGTSTRFRRISFFGSDIVSDGD